MAEQSHQVWGGDTEASIDSVNQWMRAQPWYQQQLATWGIRPDSVKLTKNQRTQILRLAQANGVKVDEGKDEIDPAGNFNPKGHKLRNTLIVAGVVGATLATMGAAGAFSGAAGAGAGGAGGAAGAAGGAGTLASTGAVGAGVLPSAAGSSLMAAGGSAAATGAGVTGAASGVGAAASGGGLWGAIARNPVIAAAGIGAGAGLAGTWMQTRAQRQAAEIEAESARQALEWQKQQYGVRQRQLAPAIGSGSAATYKLDELMGLKVPEGGYQAPPETQPGYQAPPEQSMPRGTPPQRNPNATPTVDMVQVTSPKGQPGWIPRSNLDAALRAGATQVG